MYVKSNRRIISALSFIFSFLLVLQVIPLGVSANGDVGRADGSADASASEISSDMGTSSVFDIDLLDERRAAGEAEPPATVVGEEESRRGVYEKHFRMSDGSYTAATYDLPVHYFDGSVYREIDNTLERVTVSGKTVYRTRSNSFTAEMPTSVASGNEIVLKKGSATLSFGMDNAVSVRSGEVSNSVDRVKDVASAEKISLAANASEISGYIDVENELREEMTEASGTDAVLKSNLLKQSAEIRTSEITYGIAGGTTVKYELSGNKLKESLIIARKGAGGSAGFRFRTEDYTPVLLADGSVELVRDGIAEFLIEAPYMFDAAGAVSEDISVTVTPTDDGFLYYISASRDWLYSEDRVYPVTIDPTFADKSAYSASRQVSAAVYGIEDDDAASLVSNKNTLKVGYVYGADISSLLWAQLPSGMPDTARITDARLYMYCVTKPTTAFPLFAYEITSAWQGDIYLRGSSVPSHSSDKLDYNATVTSASNSENFFYFDITGLAQSWHNGDKANNGVWVGTDSRFTSQNCAAFISKYYSGLDTYKPTYVYTYCDTAGIEPYWSYSSAAIGNSGDMSVNTFSGNYVAEFPLISTISELMPAGITLMYDSTKYLTGDKLSDCGYGMKLNLEQRIVPVENATLKAAGYNYYYLDADGTAIYLKDTTKSDGLHRLDELGYGYDAVTCSGGWRMTDKDGNVRNFNSGGFITGIIPADSNAGLTLTYGITSATRIGRITDGNGNVINITRGSYNEILSLSDSYGRTVTFNYDPNIPNHDILSSVTLADGRTITFTYNADKTLRTVRAADGNGIFIEQYNAGGNKRRVKKLTEFSSAADISDTTAAAFTSHTGGSLAFVYNAGNSTTVTSQNEQAPEKAVKTAYVFDNWGRCTSAYNDYGAAYGEYTTTTDLSKINRTALTGSVTAPVDNLVKNHSFETGTTYWTLDDSVCVVTSDHYVGYQCMRASGFADQTRMARQTVAVTKGTYTLSAYYKTDDCEGVRISLKPEGGNETGLTVRSTTDGEWKRIQWTAEVPEGCTGLTVGLGTENTSGMVYFDCVQLERSDCANDYNLLDNCNMTGNGSLWDTTWVRTGSGSVSFTDNDPTRPEFIKTGYMMPGYYANPYATAQNIKINAPAKNAVFSLSGYAKANSVPVGAPESMDKLFSFAIRFYYSDNTNEIKFLPLNTATTSWQYASKTFMPSKSKIDANLTVTYVRVYFQYYRNCNTAYVSNMNLRFDSTGTAYAYDAAGNVQSVKSLYNGEVTSNTFDAARNLTATSSTENGTWNFSYGGVNGKQLTSATQTDLGIKTEYAYTADGLPTTVTLKSTDTAYTKYLRSTTNYTADKNHVSSVTDANGGTVNYTYDSKGRTETVTSGTGQTTYTYDDTATITSDRIKTVSAKISQTENAVVGYDYDSAGRLSVITNGNTKYYLGYDAFGNKTSVGYGGSGSNADTANILAMYERDNAGRLVAVNYGDATRLEYFYDKLDRVTLVKKNGYEQYRNTYDNNGRISVYNDRVTGIKREYNYDIIGRLESVMFGNNRLDYSYNNINRLSKIKYTLNGQKRQTEYTYFKLGIPNTTKFGDGTVANTSTKSRTLDKLGRLSGETMTTDSGVTKTTSYTYKDVPNTDATTLQVTSVTDPLGTHNYTYFEDGKLRESPGELYGYDDLGQLKTSYGPKCYWYDYDNRGNITRKYYYSESGTGFDDFGVYEYTSSEWGDLLTKYNGTGITYGALGNPLNWRDGMSFTWENDRRLVSVTRNGSSAYYTYDAGGVRRTKTVGNTSLTYEYTDGKLVSQTDGTNVWWFYYDADGTRLAMEYNGEMYYYVYNIVGDVKGMYDSEGNIVAEYGYSGYGEHGYILNGAGQSVKDDPTHIANINPFRFKGYYFDAETEFYYLNTRYYDPYVCRFLNADSVIAGVGTDVNGYNLFAYCFNDPVNHSDSDGNWPKWAKIALGVVAAVAAVAATVVTFGSAAPAAACAITGVVMSVGASYATASVVATAAVAVTVAATAVYAADVAYSSVTGESPLLNVVFRGNVNAYNTGLAITSVAAGGLLEMAAQSPGVCFVAGTPVLAASGHIAIEEIKAGDMVWAENPETGEIGLKEVVQTFVNETTELINVQVGSEEIVTTPEHPFYSPVKGWVSACKLRAGDILVRSNGNYVTIDKVQHEILESPVTVYNFEVADFHTYHVGKIAVLVHNTCRGKPTSPNQMQKQVERGQAPSTVVRVDNPKIPWQLPHIHFSDGTAMNIDGSVHDAMRGTHTLTNSERIWIFDNGWGG